MIPKIFWGRYVCIFADLADTKFGPIALPSEITNPCKKKGKNGICVLTLRLWPNGRKISKTILVDVLDALYMDRNKFFE